MNKKIQSVFIRDYKDLRGELKKLILNFKDCQKDFNPISSKNKFAKKRNYVRYE